jgi:hypothetical protein
MQAIIAAAVEAAMAAQGEAAATPAKPARKGGKAGSKGSAVATSARKGSAAKDGYKPTAAKRKQHATARMLWALNEAGCLSFDASGGNAPVKFGAAFDCISALRKGQ